MFVYGDCVSHSQLLFSYRNTKAPVLGCRVLLINLHEDRGVETFPLDIKVINLMLLSQPLKMNEYTAREYSNSSSFELRQEVQHSVKETTSYFEHELS